MTAWASLSIMATIVAKCALCIVGLEYGNSHQPMTDQEFMYATIACIGIGLFADICNCSKHNRER